MKFITREGLKQLDHYSYKGGAYSWLDCKINPFWIYLTEFLPLSMAPNLVTFIGWIFMILSYFGMLIYDFTFTQEIPRWTFFFAATCIFIYGNMDAMDGKQARRTNSSSPLGQLFDHGCDSFSLSFFVLAACQATLIQKEAVFLIFFGAQVAFWTSNWIEYHTGVLQTNVGNFGVTECQLICMLIHIVTGIFGQGFWAISLDFFLPQSVTAGLYSSWPLFQTIMSVKVKELVVYSIGILLPLLSVVSFLKMVLNNKESKVKMLFEWSGLILIFAMGVIWFKLPIYEKYTGAILVNFGLITSLIVCKVIISSVTKMKLDFFHKELIPLLISTGLMVRYNTLGMEKGVAAVFWGSLVVNLITTLWFLSGTIKQITQYLGIQCFSLKKVPRKLE